MEMIDRRTLLLGAAGLFAAGCSGGGSGPTAKRTSTGPVIVKPRTGNVVTTKETAVLRDRLNAAFASRDVEQMVQLIDPGDYALDAVRDRWARRFDNFERLGFIEGEWFVGAPRGRTRNGAGGIVEYNGDLVFAHRVRSCDAQQVVESYSASFRKKSEDAPLELLPIWDVAKVDAIETKHAWIVFREEDAARAKAFAGRIENGARRAFDLMPRPQGVDKVFYALTWPQIDGRLYGGVAVSDALAHAYYHPFLKPEDLATGERTLSDAGSLPKATGRIGLHQASFRQDDFEDTACHEAVHVLANQWHSGFESPIWTVEGLATWSEGVPKVMAERGRIRAAWSAFEDVVPKNYKAFHDSPMEFDFYLCSAAVYAYLEDHGGRDAVFETASTYYSASVPEEAEEKLGRSQQELMAATRKWLGA
jgi:hypothetical protein